MYIFSSGTDDSEVGLYIDGIMASEIGLYIIGIREYWHTKNKPVWKSDDQGNCEKWYNRSDENWKIGTSKPKC